MKLDLTSLSFNSNLKEGVGTPSWGTALGQSEGYNITSDGANDLLLGMFNNKINESQLTHNLRGEKEILLAACFKNVTINGTEIDKPLILAIVEEHSQSHDGRKSLKYNDKFSFIDSSITISNEEFYENAQNILGKESCWFAHEFNVINGKTLNIIAIIASDKPVTYPNSKVRKDEWSRLIGENPDKNIEDFDLIQSNKIREFLFEVFKFLQKEFGDKFLIEKSAIAKRKLSETNYQAFILPDYFDGQPILGSFDNEQSEESLKTSNTLRYFPENLKILEQKYIYFSTQWGFPQFHHSPSFISFNKFVLDYSNNKYRIEIEHVEIGQIYTLVLNGIQEAIPQIAFEIDTFQLKTEEAGLIFNSQLIQRFIASLLTKPFVICSGLSGSGKTKLAQAFVYWISESDMQYKIIPVGADWTNREPLLGYPNGLDPKSYVTPDSGALQLILEASKNQNKPYFMILDEMNLSHVERYFADFLSIMESKEKLKLYSGEKRYSQYTKENEFDEEYFIPYEIEWPQNLFIIGTVNIDETTYMFSPKVLDRANVIEFRITPNEMNKFFKERKELNMKELFLEKDKSKGGAGQNMAENFLQLAEIKTITKIPEIEGDNNVLNQFFAELQIVGSEFGYRSASEIELLITKLGVNGFIDEQGQSLNNNTKIDIAIMQKLLPKLHGSRKKLVGPLETLAGFCLVRINESIPDDQNKTKTLYQQFISEKRDSAKWEIKYSISFEKIERMLKNVIENGFTSYAEA